jgi:hypothetical protein
MLCKENFTLWSPNVFESTATSIVLWRESLQNIWILFFLVLLLLRLLYSSHFCFFVTSWLCFSYQLQAWFIKLCCNLWGLFATSTHKQKQKMHWTRNQTYLVVRPNATKSIICRVNFEMCEGLLDAVNLVKLGLQYSTSYSRSFVKHVVITFVVSPP